MASSSVLTNPGTQKSQCRRGYIVSHQELCFTKIDFTQHHIVGSTELTIHPSDPDLRYLHLNFKQGRILDVTVSPLHQDLDSTGANDVFRHRLMCHFCPGDPTATLFPRGEERNAPTLRNFQEALAQKCFTAELDVRTAPVTTGAVPPTQPSGSKSSFAAGSSHFKNRGELTIILPPEVWPTIKQLQPFTVVLAFEFRNPSSGYYFVEGNMNSLDAARSRASIASLSSDLLTGSGVGPGMSLDSQDGRYLFTAFPHNHARLCFPCVDSYSELCSWTLVLRVPEDMVAVGVGRLLHICHAVDDILMKDYFFYLKQPTAAPFIGFAVGTFAKLQDLQRQEVTHFCPPPLLPLLCYSTSTVADILDFYEELLGCRLPYSSMQIVFVDSAYEEVQCFASLLVLSIQLLFHPRLIDETFLSRKILARGLARLFFGTFLSTETWSSVWLPWGVALYMAGLYEKKTFGVSEYRHYIWQELHHVTQFEEKTQVIALDPTHVPLDKFPFHPKCAHTCSSHYLEMYRRKAHLVIRMLEQRLGEKVVLLVLKKLMRVATTVLEETRRDAGSKSGTMGDFSGNGSGTGAGDNDRGPSSVAPGYLRRGPLNEAERGKFLLSTASFRVLVSQVTGEDIDKFLEQWVTQPGHVHLRAKYGFNRKRNVLEVEIVQDVASAWSVAYSGPIAILMQELDGSYQHIWKLDETRKVFELQCHAKSSKRNRRKLIPVMGGIEKSMDLNMMDASAVDSSVLWLRLDPDLYLLARIRFQQPDYMWRLMLRYEADCLAELQALHALKHLTYSEETYYTLVEIIKNERVFHRVRSEACYCLVKLCNEAPHKAGQDLILIQLYQKLFSQADCEKRLIRKNDFHHLPSYFLQCHLLLAIGKMRNRQKVCPREVVLHLLEWAKLNDNTHNQYCDSHFKACLLQALKSTLPQSMSTGSTHLSSSRLSAEIRQIVEDVTLRANLDCLSPSHGFVVTRACLLTLRELQKCGFLPVDARIFKQHCGPNYPHKVRLTAFECVVDYVRVEKDTETLQWLLERVLRVAPEDDLLLPHAAPRLPPLLQYEVVRRLIDVELFRRGQETTMNQRELVLRLWRSMSCEVDVCSYEPRLRAALAELYLALYGMDLPTPLGGERVDYSAGSSHSEVSDLDESSDRRRANVSKKKTAFRPQSHTFKGTDLFAAEESSNEEFGGGSGDGMRSEEDTMEEGGTAERRTVGGKRGKKRPARGQTMAAPSSDASSDSDDGDSSRYRAPPRRPGVTWKNDRPSQMATFMEVDHHVALSEEEDDDDEA